MFAAETQRMGRIRESRKHEPPLTQESSPYRLFRLLQGAVSRYYTDCTDFFKFRVVYFCSICTNFTMLSEGCKG